MRHGAHQRHRLVRAERLACLDGNHGRAFAVAVPADPVLVDRQVAHRVQQRGVGVGLHRGVGQPRERLLAVAGPREVHPDAHDPGLRQGVGHSGEATVLVAPAAMPVVDHDQGEPLVGLADRHHHRGRDLRAA